MQGNKVFIGIDCDVSKSGVCVYRSKTDFQLYNMSFFELLDFLESFTEEIFVVIEAGWENKSNWHTNKKGSAALNAKIGSDTGANHEVGKKIVEMCEYLNLKYKTVRPTKTKLNAETFKNLTRYEGRTNSEQRDSLMLVWGM